MVSNFVSAGNPAELLLFDDGLDDLLVCIVIIPRTESLIRDKCGGGGSREGYESKRVTASTSLSTLGSSFLACPLNLVLR